MAINPPGVTPPHPGDPVDPIRTSRMDPYVRPRGRTAYWVVGAIIVATLVLGFFFMRAPSTVPPAATTTGETAPTPEPVPVEPAPPATTTPTVPVTPTQPEPTAPTQP